jgi:putative transposase
VRKTRTLVNGNVAELSSNIVHELRGTSKIDWQYTTPGKPTQNAFADSIYGRMPGKLSNKTQFTSLNHVRAKIAAWTWDYKLVA